MAAMAMTLDKVAGELDVHRALARAAVVETGTAPPDLAEIQLVAAWVRETATDLRRRALDLLSADRSWRHGGLLDHLAGVAKAEWSGVVEGVENIGVGLVTAGRLSAEGVVEPLRVGMAWAKGGWQNAKDEAVRYEKRQLALDVAVGRNLVSQNPVGWVSTRIDEVRQDGFWAAAEDTAHDVGVQAPGAVLTAVSMGAGAVAEESTALRAMAAAADLASDVANASYLAPPPSNLGSVAHHAALALSIDAGEGRRVGLDPGDGRFVVFQPGEEGLVTHKTRWSGLGAEDRKVLRDAGLVDRHGHLRGEGAANG